MTPEFTADASGNPDLEVIKLKTTKICFKRESLWASVAQILYQRKLKWHVIIKNEESRQCRTNIS